MLSNSALEEKLRKNGFVKVPFWSDEQVAAVKKKYSVYFEKHHISDKGFHTTHETTNYQLITEVNNYLQPLILSTAQTYLNNATPVNAAFLIKKSGNGSESPLHQDASFVDEPQNRSVSIWIALDDADSTNGCLQFIPGTHNLFTAPRYIPYTNKHIEPFADILKPYLTTNNIKAGEAFIFYNSVLHYSPSNKTSRNRLAVVMGFINKGATLSLYWKNELTGTCDRHAITPEDLAAINTDFKPSPESLLSSEFNDLQISDNDINQFILNTFSPIERVKAFIKSKVLFF